MITLIALSRLTAMEEKPQNQKERKRMNLQPDLGQYVIRTVLKGLLQMGFVEAS
jgi:hypothetical protein